MARRGVSRSSSVVSITRMTLGWFGSTTAFRFLDKTDDYVSRELEDDGDLEPETVEPAFSIE